MQTTAAYGAKRFDLDSPLLKVEAVAHLLQISRSKAWRLITDGDIESVLIGANRRVPREALESYIQKLREAS